MANDVATKMKEISGWLETPGIQASITKACAKHLTGERLTRIVMSAISRNQGLLECTKESLYSAVLCCGQLGLEPSLLGEAYLVPYNNSKMGRKEVQFQVGYKGLVALARRSGDISTITAECVHEKDTFSYRLGDDPKIEHIPALDDEPGSCTHVYAIAKLKDGGIQRVVMTKGAIEKIRTRSKAGSSGPWVTDWEEMAKKTAIKRLCKLLPMSIELADAIDTDTSAESDVPMQLKDVPAEVVDTTAPKSRNSAKARAAISKPEPEVVPVEAEPLAEKDEPESYLTFFTSLLQRNPDLFAKTIAKASEADPNFMGVKTEDDLARFDEADLSFLMTQYQLVI